MKTVTIRNIPDNVYQVVTRLAKRNRRSLQQQIVMLMDRARTLDVESPVARAGDIRRRLQGRPMGDTVREIREDRNR